MASTPQPPPPTSTSPNQNDPNAPSTSPAPKKDLTMRDPLQLTALLERAMGGITYTFFTFAFNFVFGQNQLLVTFVVILEVFILWMFFANFLRMQIYAMLHMRVSRSWNNVVVNLIDFFSLVGVFLVVQFMLLVFSGNSTMSPGEIVVGVFVIVSTGFSAVQTADSLTCFSVECE